MCSPILPEELFRERNLPLSEVYERVKGTGIHFQICNHNYLLVDASHRAKGYRRIFMTMAPMSRGILMGDMERFFGIVGRCAYVETAMPRSEAYYSHYCH